MKAKITNLTTEELAEEMLIAAKIASEKLIVSAKADAEQLLLKASLTAEELIMETHREINSIRQNNNFKAIEFSKRLDAKIKELHIKF